MTETLEEYVRRKVREGLKPYDALMNTYREVEEGRIKLSDPNPPSSFKDYIIRPDYSSWFWTAVGLITLSLISIPLSAIPGLAVLRYVLGSIYVLFIPGYVLIEALYPKEDSLKPLERLALSIGLSLAIIPLIGLILNYTPWGIRLTPIIISTLAYSIAMLLIAAYRKYSIVKLRIKALSMVGKQ